MVNSFACDEECLAVGRAIKRATDCLPNGAEICIQVIQGRSGVTLIEDDGQEFNVTDCDDDSQSLSKRIIFAIDFAAEQFTVEK